MRSSEGDYCINGLAVPPYPSEVQTDEGPMVLRRVRSTYVLYQAKEHPKEAA